MARDIFMRFEIITANVQQMFPQPRNERLYLENFKIDSCFSALCLCRNLQNQISADFSSPLSTKHRKINLLLV